MVKQNAGKAMQQKDGSFTDKKGKKRGAPFPYTLL
jgi:hypothetical protein